MSEFTIVLPTTKDRVHTLEPVLRNVQQQSLADWELCIIGDGVTPETRALVQGWCGREARMRFYDHAKDGSRGERFRHDALAGAKGRKVAYLCDRDLWLHDHLETLAKLLDQHEFAHTGRLSVELHGGLRYPVDIDLAEPAQRDYFRVHGIPVGMSQVGHRMDTYRRLPHGWRTTPRGVKTDRYMWQQFLEGGCSAGSSDWPTVLNFNRGDHPGWPSAQRGEELSRWQAQLPDAQSEREFRAQAMRDLAGPMERARHAWRSWLYWHPRAQDAYLRLRGGRT